MGHFRPLFFVLTLSLTLLACTSDKNRRSDKGLLLNGEFAQHKLVTARTEDPPVHRQEEQTLSNDDEVPRKVLIRSDYKAGEITSLCEGSIVKAKSRFDDIARVPAELRSVENTLLSLEAAFADFSDEVGSLTFMGYVSPQKELRDEAMACVDIVDKFYIDVMARKDLYQAVKSAQPRNTSEQRLYSETVLGFELNGLKLEDSQLEELKKLKTELAAKESEFSKNLNEDTTSVSFTEEELEGVPPDFITRLKRDEQDKCIVTTKSTDNSMVMDNAKRPETRKRMLFAYTNRAADKNTKLLEGAIVLRQQIAKILGFKTWADYRTSTRMAQNSENVSSLLTSLKDKLAQRNRADISLLLESKKLDDLTANAIEAWDISYYANQVKKTKYNLNKELIREYFPRETVMKGLFEVYSKILGVRYEQVVDAPVWSPDVQLYAVREGSTNKVIAYFYTDLSPRAGKYGHAAAFSPVNGRFLADGKYNKPVSAIVANFTPPTDDRPSLLSHDEVETLFHEFGHIMHQVLTRAPYASQSGSAVARDFVEAPSQMLENWVWSSDILKLLSGHYKDASQKLPEELLKQMLAAQDFNVGYFYTRQLVLGLTDLTYHTAEGAVDATTTYNNLYRELLGIEPIEGGNFVAGFGHLMGGYDAGYYGYIWSEVYAADMFTRFEKEGLLNSETGVQYRRIILEQGNMKPALDLVREFLGREPNNEAFYKRLGITN